MEDKQFNVYQIVLAYLFGRYQAYKAEGRAAHNPLTLATGSRAADQSTIS